MACAATPGTCAVAVFDTTSGTCSLKTDNKIPRQTQKFVACVPKSPAALGARGARTTALRARMMRAAHRARRRHARGNAAVSLPPDAPPMTTPREQFGLIALPNGRLMALGGANINTGDVLNSTEVYDFSTKTWSPGPSMLSERQCGIFQLVGDKKIYAVGGEDSTQAVATTMEVLDLPTQTWTFAPTASTKHGPWTRESFGAGLIGSKMFFVGGQKDDGDLTTLRGCTFFDTDTAEWGKCASMAQARSDFGLAVFDGKLYVMGGFDLAINFPIGGFLDSAEV